jgi:biopolymer transport protein ExbD
MNASSDTGGEPIAEMNVIPFIDICLVLLIIVLVTATFSTQLLDFDHPQAAKTEFVEARAGVAVDVAPDGACLLGGRRIESASLRGEIEALGGPDVILRASRKTPSRHVIAAADQVKACGRGRLAFELTD